jgi:F-type H+-transporting ATPase subunit g
MASAESVRGTARPAPRQGITDTGGTLTPTAGIVPQLQYYSKVGLELGKLIVHQRAMAPP